MRVSIIVDLENTFSLPLTLIFVSLPIHSDLRSSYPAGLEAEPKLSDLMNEVAAKIPSRWREVGIQLEISNEKLSCFTSTVLDNFSCVFTIWKTEATSPYKWSTLIDALKAPAVNEITLAEKLKNKLT